MKHFAILTFVVVAAHCIVISHCVGFTQGIIEADDRLLYTENVVVKAVPNKMVSKDIVFPPKGSKKQELITAIRVNDESYDKIYGSGHASVSSGGPGNREVVLHLQSFRNQGLNFTVKIWGTPDL